MWTSSLTLLLPLAGYLAGRYLLRRPVDSLVNANPFNLTVEELERARLEAELEAGLVEPYLVLVEDGIYREELVTHLPECELVEVTNLEDVVPSYVHSYRVPACKPRYRQELRFRRV
jgi:hypothetical protein